MTNSRIDRGEVESELQALQAELLGEANDRKGSITSVLIVGVVTVLVIAYLLGRRAGRLRSGFIEIRR